VSFLITPRAEFHGLARGYLLGSHFYWFEHVKDQQAIYDWGVHPEEPGINHYISPGKPKYKERKINVPGYRYRHPILNSLYL
jgi:hypothetical protein